MKVAIVCGSPSSEFLAPFDNPEWAIWVLGNRLNRFDGKRVNCVFEIHDNLSEHKDPNRYAEWLVSQDVGLVVGEAFPLKADHVVTFDYAASEKLFGSLYLTSSPAYMISHAISEGANEIAIYGVDLSVDDHEYFWQRPCVEAWIGFAKGRGIKVYVPDVSHVGKCSYVEGRDWNGKKSSGGLFSVEDFDRLAQEHRQKRAQIAEDQRALEIKEAAHYGAQQVYERLSKVARAAEAKIDMKSLSETALIK